MGYTSPSTATLMRSGVYFDFNNPRMRDVNIEDIAYGLARLVRFNGQGKGFYSVGEHSVHVSNLVSSEYALESLLHDAHEAYIGDVISPLKSVLPDFERLDKAISALVRQALGVPTTISAQTHKADMRMLALEQKAVMESDDLWPACSGLSLPEIEIGFWAPEVAEQKFLERYWNLVSQSAA